MTNKQLILQRDISVNLSQKDFDVLTPCHFLCISLQLMFLQLIPIVCLVFAQAISINYDEDGTDSFQDDEFAKIPYKGSNTYRLLASFLKKRGFPLTYDEEGFLLPEVQDKTENADYNNNENMDADPDYENSDYYEDAFDEVN